MESTKQSFKPLKPIWEANPDGTPCKTDNTMPVQVLLTHDADKVRRQKDVSALLVFF